MAIRPIQILKGLVEDTAHTITITSVESLGSGLYKLNTENTLYLRAAKKVTIDSVAYKVTDFVLNSYVTVTAVDGSDTAVTVSTFDIDSPLFLWGNPQMVSAELQKRIDLSKRTGDQVHPYIWLVEIGSTSYDNSPQAAVKTKPTFNIFFLDSNKYDDWTISDHYANGVDTMSNYRAFFIDIINTRRDIFENDSITYTTVNHVNFGDYIVDQGMKERILNDDVTGVQLQIELPYIVNECTTEVITSRCSPVTILVNGVFDQLKPQGTTYDCITSGSSIYDILVNGIDSGQDLDFDGTNHTINLG